MLKFIKDHRVILCRAIILFVIGLGFVVLVLSGGLHRIFSLKSSGISLITQTITSLNKLLSNTHIIILVLSMPTFFLLWLFRTYDTNQNRKNNEANLSANSFFNSLNLLTKNDPLSKQIAIKRLMYLRDNKLYPKKEIELVINKSKLDLQNTNLSKVILNGLNLTQIDLRGANLEGAKLLKTNLEGAKLLKTNLIGANLRDAKLEGADLTNVDLTNVDLTDADLRGANLTNVDLTDVHLMGTNLTKADLKEAHLMGTNLTKADLMDVNLKSAKYNSKTTFPNEFNYKEQGMIKVKEEQVRVINTNNISNHTCRCGSGLAHWVKFSKSPRNQFCYVLGCVNKLEVGAHVQKYHSSDQNKYLILLCKNHNKMKNLILDLVDYKKFILSEKSECSF